MIRAFRWLVLAILGAGLIVAISLYAAHRASEALFPPPETIVAASLQGLREQNRLSAFAADYVAVVTATQSRFGLSARKTLILPGMIRYEVDLAKLRAEDVRWDTGSGALFVTLPPLEVEGPQVDLTRMREYDGGGLLLRVGDVGERLDLANRRAAQAELLRQARAPVPMNLAREATRRAIERSFAMPLRATGVTATVRVRFPDEPGFAAGPTPQIDRSRSLEEVYGTANAATERR